MGCLFPCFRAQSTNSGGDSVSHRKHLLLLVFIWTKISTYGEDQFLEACCTTPATLVKIRKASENLETPQRGKKITSPQFDSWISSNSNAVFHVDEKTLEPCGEEVSEQTPSSCITDSQNSAKISTGYSDAGEESQGSIGTAFRDGVDRTTKLPLTTGKIKSVRFECDFDQSYTSSSSKNNIPKIPEKAGESTFSAATSLNLTSLKLSDEIQTHGTIFPVNTESTIKGIPSVQACKVKTGTESALSVTCEGNLEDSSASISHLVKLSEEKSNNNMAALSTITSRDRPIIGMVAAHWNEKEQSQISPKWWDGNGIPNSSNKYKEDQKVSWHATPFEERLEKALSEEGGQAFIPSRKLEVMEEGERDTAMSQLHHSAQSTSIVSF